MLAAFAARAEEPLGISAGEDNEPIAYVVLQHSRKNITQTASAKGRIRLTSGKLMLREVGLADGSVLRSFSFGNRIVLRDYAQWQPRHRTGIGVVRPNGTVERFRRGSTRGFARALQAVFNNANLNNYWCDDESDMYKARWPALDLLWSRGFLEDACLVIMERDGNSPVQLEALGADGQLIPGARTLEVTWRFDWNTRFANARYISNQPYWLTVVSLQRFFDATAVPPQAIHGIRAYNNSEADLKIFVGQVGR